jgi:cytidylate kinase
MWKNIGYEKCLSFINCQLNPQQRALKPEVRPAVTISRMTGAGGRTVAGKLVDYLQEHVPAPCAWTVFDKNLMEKVLDDHDISRRVEKYEPESHQTYFRDAFEEFLGLHPSSWEIVQKTADTIMKLASMGFVVLVGRGANVVAAKLPNTFHVRLVASLKRRIERVQEVYGLVPEAAAEFVKTEDKSRRRYLKDHYHQEIDDPMIYDLVINTDRIGYDGAARMIGSAVIDQFHLVKPKAELVV